MANRTANDSRLRELDALRGFAAAAVLMFHLAPGPSSTDDGAPWYSGHDILPVLFGVGHYGVELFFIISGFVIFMTLQRADSIRDFVVSRVARLFPAYWCGVMLTCAFAYAIEAPSLSRAYIAVNMTMLQSFFLVPNLDGSYWTLAIELEFYVLIGIIFVAGMMPKINTVCIALLAALALLQTALSQWEVNTAIWGTPSYARYGFASYGGLFIVGICLFRLRSKQGSWSTYGCLVLAILYSAWCGPNPMHPATFFQYLCLTGALTATVWLAVNGHIRILRWSPLVFLGSISYPIYLLHERIGLDVIAASRHHGLSDFVSLGMAILVVASLAITVHIWFELPGRRYIRKVMTRDAGNLIAARRPDVAI